MDTSWWGEYDSAAHWCAVRGLSGGLADPLPENLSARVMDEIGFDPEAFQRRVREMAYGRAMKR